MNRTVIYVGEPVPRLGRFGKVEPGDELLLNSEEYRSVVDDPRFAVGDLLDITPGEPPAPAEGFDLREISWRSPNLYSRLKRKSRAQINKVAQAINEIDPGKVEFGNQLTIKQTADSILSYAEINGWTLQPLPPQKKNRTRKPTPSLTE